MNDDPKKQQAIDTVRLRENDRRELLETLKKGARAPGREARKYPRFAYAAEHIIVTITPAAGNTDTYLVVPRNISVGGLGFIHGQFVHAKSRCQVVLPTLTGAWFRVIGKVVRCRHAKGMIHEVSVEFEERIDPLMFVDPHADPATIDPLHPAAADVEEAAGHVAPRSRGTILLVEDAEEDRALYGRWHRQQGLTVVDAADGARALAWLEQGKEVSLAQLPLHAGHSIGADLIRQVRRRGYKGPILAISDDGSDEARARAAAAGCNAFLAKPCVQRSLALAVDQLLSFDGNLSAGEGGAPILSTLEDTPETRTRVTEFLEPLKSRLEKLRVLAEAGQRPQAAALCQDLRTGGDALGFPALSQMARLALGRLQEPAANPEAIKHAVKELTAVAKRLAGR